MRIIGGTAAGRILKVPKGFEVRPTPDLVRQAVFNSLGQRVIGARVLELFAGSGALGLECLSRGAESVLCVEKSQRVARFIRDNLDQADMDPARLGIRAQDAFSILHQFSQEHRRFDLILADPPYGEKNIGRRSSSFAQKLLDNASLSSILEARGWFILGHSKRDTLDVPPAWTETKTLKHGDSVFRFLKVAG